MVAAENRECDLLVYGGTPAGIAAAVAAADEGRSVVLIEPYSFVGGLASNGLTHTDFRSLESLTGVWHEFNRRVVAHYTEAYGADSEQVAATYHGNFAEPKVNRQVFESMLAERKVEVVTRHLLDGVASTRSMPSAILSARFVPRDGDGSLTVRARVYIDASYEGDLMAKAGVRYVVGREDEAAYGEPVAKDVPAGGDRRVQGYNFRWCVTNLPERLPAPRPEGYDRAEFLPLLDLYADGRLTHVFGVQAAAGLDLPEELVAVTSKAPYKLQPPLLPNGKADINDMSRGVVRLSMPDMNDAYPEADVKERRRIVAEHVRYQVGMLHFLQHDEAVPEAVKKDALSWGFCPDEWPEHGHLPEQIYVREARRMVGRHVFTQNDTRLPPDDVRIPLVAESIAIGDYSHNCHGVGREGTRFEGTHTGEFYERNAPYQIAYGTLVPNEVTNLLVPVAASASHVGLGALRLEPVWTGMGHAAGLAAHLALAQERPTVQTVSVPELQTLLHRQGAATLYVSDVPPGHPDFVAVQWIGALGGWHGLAKPEGGVHPDWTTRFGQYCEPFPNHQADLESPVNEALLARWREVLPEAKRSVLESASATARTRGELLRTLHLAVLSIFDGFSTEFPPAAIVGEPSTKPTPNWLQFCGSPDRNNVTFAQNIPTSWDIESQSNIKWMAKLGSQSYGSPVIANGKVMIGTNNGAGYLERLPNSIDLGCLLCFRESDGQFLWQHSSRKLPTGRVHDRPLQGVCSTPIVEGDRLWYVTNRGEIVCLDTEGFHDDEDDGPLLGAGSRLFEVSPNLNELAKADSSPADQRLVRETIRLLLLSKQLPVPQPFGIRQSGKRNEWIVKTLCREQKEFYRMTLQGSQLRVFDLAEHPVELLSVEANLLEGLDEGHLSDSLRHQFQAHGVQLSDDLQVKVIKPFQSWEVMMTRGDTISSFNLSIESGRLSCLQKVTGDLKREADIVWSFDMMIELGVQQHAMANCSPTIWGDVLFVCTSNGVDESHLTVPAPEAPSFLALHKKTGKVLWTDNSPGENILHGQWSSPAVGVIDGVAQVIFAGGDGWLYSFQADRWQEGKPVFLWKFDCNPKESQWIIGGRGTRNNIVATPVIYENRVYVAVGQDPEHGAGEGCLWCIDPTKRGDISDQLVVDAQGQPVPHRRTNVINTETGERVISHPNSGVVWSYRRFDTNQDGKTSLRETMHRSLAGPAIKDDLLFIADLVGVVHCLDAKTGKVHWTCDLLAASWAVPLIVGNRVFVVDEDGDVAILELSASPEKSLNVERTTGGMEYNVPKTEIRMNSSIYSTPAVANEVLYISTRNRLYAIGAKEKAE